MSIYSRDKEGIYSRCIVNKCTCVRYRKNEKAIHEMELASSLDPVPVLTNSMAWHVYVRASLPGKLRAR